MNNFQQIIILTIGFLGLIFFLTSLLQIKNRKNVYGLTPFLFFLGGFVWGDMFILGPFWLIVSLMSLILNNFNLFLLIVSLFWLVRSFGEIIYWINEQFAGKNRNPPHTLKFHKIFQGDSIWFIYQLFWQCCLIFSIIFSLYFGVKLFGSI